MGLMMSELPSFSPELPFISQPSLPFYGCSCPCSAMLKNNYELTVEYIVKEAGQHRPQRQRQGTPSLLFTSSFYLLSLLCLHRGEWEIPIIKVTYDNTYHRINLNCRHTFSHCFFDLVAKVHLLTCWPTLPFCLP